MIEKVAVKDGHTPDHRIGEVHNDVDGTAVGDIHGVQPHRIGNGSIVLGLRQEMHLMDVHGMQLVRSIDNFPMLIGSDLGAHHRGRIGREFFAVDVKAVLVFREDHGESSRRFFLARQVHSTEIRLDRGL